MNKFKYVGYVVSIFAILFCRGTNAQDSSYVRVNEMGAHQYFAVLVKDVERSVSWYCTVFGLVKLGGAKAEDGSWQIENLGNKRLLVEIIQDDRAQLIDRARGFRKVGFEISDVVVVADRVERATGERPRVLDFVRSKVRIIQLQDPDGNIIQLLSSLVSHE